MSTLYKYKKQIKQTLVPDLLLRNIKDICSGLFTNIQVTKKSLLQCSHYNYDDINQIKQKHFLQLYGWFVHINGTRTKDKRAVTQKNKVK